MKPILLKTLAAATLAATANAEVHVMGAVWKERGADASTGVIDHNPGTVALTRAYLIFEPSLLTETPLPATKIEYMEVRGGGTITRTYTIDSAFQDFHGDNVTGSSGGPRTYGNIYSPVYIADVSDATIPFTGKPFSSGFPKKITFEKTSFVTGSSTGTTGPRLVPQISSTAKYSTITGGANPVKVSATTVSGAVEELEARLVKAGYSRGASAPEIATDLPASIAREGYTVALLSVTLGDDVFPTPTYQWYKDDVGGEPVEIPGATSATFIVAAGTDGDGTYSAVITNSGGSVTTGKTVVTTTDVAMEFTTDLPATMELAANETGVLMPVVNSNAFPQPVSYQWERAAAAAGPFSDIDDGDGGTLTQLTVSGNNSAVNGPGFYRVVVNNGTDDLTSAVCEVKTITPDL